MKRRFNQSLGSSASGGFTLLEVLIGLSILTAGILAIMAVFPSTMKSSEMAELRTIGAFLGQMKVEEIRRDYDQNGKLMNAIKTLSQPTDPIPFAMEPRLAYRLSSTTMIYLHRDAAGNVFDDPTDPRDDPGVARVIVQISPLFRPGKQVILDEFRFDR